MVYSKNKGETIASPFKKGKKNLYLNSAFYILLLLNYFFGNAVTALFNIKVINTTA